MKKRKILLNLKRAWYFIKQSRFNLVGYLLISIVEAIIAAILPLFSAKVILNITNGVMEQLILSGLAVFFVDLVLYFMMYFKGYFYRKIYLKTLIELQKAISSEILKLEISEIDKNTSGLFIDRLNKDTQDMSSIFMEYAYYMSYIITNVGVLLTILILNKYLFVYAVFTSVVLFFVDKKRLSIQYSYIRKLKKLQESKTGLTSELVRGIRDIKVLNASKTVLKQTTDKIVETTNEETRIIRTGNSFNYLKRNLSAIFDLGFLILGSYLYTNSLLTIPIFIIVYNYQGKVKNLLTGIVQISEYNKKFVVASDRVFEVIENNRFKKEKFGNKEIKKLTGSIEFKNVSFGYTKTKVLKDINFKIKPNERVAFVGKSGEGKTTIFSLIEELYHANSGEILLDGEKIENLTCNTIRNNMSIITQNPYIFNFTIKENLLLANPTASMKDIKNACSLACIDDFINDLPDKYDTVLGENGVILSGGQKQRIAIARALLMKTKIILFDEATSALDNETQSKITDAINNLKGEYTILIVAHRLSTIIDSDRIFVIDGGNVIDSGTHKELLKRCDIYKNLYNIDFN